MEIKDILRHSIGEHQGYMLTTVSLTTLTKDELVIYKQLKRLPQKITAYFDRSKIKTVYKSDCFPNPLNNYYIIQTIDDTLFVAQY